MKSPHPETCRLNPDRAAASPELIEIARAGLKRLESLLDRCAEAISRFDGEAPLPGDSIGEKVRVLIPEGDDISWLGQAILESQALLNAMEARPETAETVIARFLHRWGADTQSPAWARKNTADRLRQILELFLAGLDGFHAGLLSEAE